MMTTDGPWFRDAEGRRLLLRGVNLGGDSKGPTDPDGRTHIATDWADHRRVSFVGRPFPLAQADEHFARLRHWGFNVLRFLVTWEAIEHAGPGQYDEAYLDYVRAVVERAGDYGLTLFIDPHQDVWSRMSGGDGAPGWTLELAGFDLARLDVSEAAITHQNHAASGKAYPYTPMIWPNNWARLASATMFTLFFGGERIAPHMQVEGESIQRYLQRHFIGAMQRVAERVADLPHVLGYDSLNEPSSGYLGLHSLSQPLPIHGSAPRLTPFEGMALGAGFPVEATVLERRGLELVEGQRVTLNPNGISAWRAPDADIWQRHGVWEIGGDGQPRLLRDDYFAGFRFFEDGVVPFAQRYIAALRAIHPRAMLFVEGEPGHAEPLRWQAERGSIVNASHWYDTLTLLTKRYDPDAAHIWGKPGAQVTGREAVAESFAAQIGALARDSREGLGDVPTLVGEFGVPFDLEGGASFRSDDFSAQAAALDSYYDALDANLVHGTLWNYSASNSNAHGDGWNEEDLSIFSRDQQWNPYDLDSGGRAIEGFVRPTVRAAAGTPTFQRFVRETGDYELRLTVEPIEAPTVLYVPRLAYREGYEVTVSSGTVEEQPMRQQLLWFGATPGPQWMRIRRVRDER